MQIKSLPRVITIKLAPINVKEALSVANKIGDYLHKSESLLAIAQALSSTDVDKGEKLFDEAVSLASNVYDEELKPGALSKVAQGLVPINVKETLSVANTIDALFDKSEALSAIAQALASSDHLA